MNKIQKVVSGAVLAGTMALSVNGWALNEVWELTDLHIATSEGDTAEVKRLIQAGADVDALNDQGETSLVIAVYSGDTEIVRALIHAGAEMKEKSGLLLRRTPLYGAAENGHTEIVRALIQAGADMNARTPTPLDIAATNGHTEIVRALIQAGADMNVRHDWLGQTSLPLYSAAENGHTEIVRVLIQAGARVGDALLLAVKDGQSAMIKLLLKPEYNLTQEDIDSILIEIKDPFEAITGTPKGVKLLNYHWKKRGGL